MSALPRCCKEGGLLYSRDRTYSCIAVPLPDSINVEPYLKQVSMSDAKQIGISDTENYRCRDILFDQDTGLIMHTVITVKMDTGSYKDILQYKTSPRVSIKKCCNDWQVLNREGCLTKDDAFNKYEGILSGAFRRFFTRSSRPLTSDKRYKSVVKFGAGGVNSSKTNDLFVLGDDILEVSFEIIERIIQITFHYFICVHFHFSSVLQIPNKSQSVVGLIMNAADTLEWCINSSEYTRYDMYTLQVSENDLGIKSQYSGLINNLLH